MQCAELSPEWDEAVFQTARIREGAERETARVLEEVSRMDAEVCPSRYHDFFYHRLRASSGGG